MSTVDTDHARLSGKRVAVLIAPGVDRPELVEPLAALRHAGADIVLLAPEAGAVRMADSGEASVAVSTAVASADPADFDALLLPGGAPAVDRLRTSGPSLAFIRAFFVDGKPVAAIGHAPFLLVAARTAAERTVTSDPALRTALTDAGAEWIDEEVCVDGTLLTCRGRRDLPAFCGKLIEKVAEGQRRTITL